jgi:hypothetical protein
VLLVLGLVTSTAIVHAQSLPGKPVKIVLSTDQRSYDFGSPIKLVLTLVDRENSRVATQEDIEVVIVARGSSSRARVVGNIRFESGESSMEHVLEGVIAPPGLVYVGAKHGSLLEGGVRLLIKKPRVEEMVMAGAPERELSEGPGPPREETARQSEPGGEASSESSKPSPEKVHPVLITYSPDRDFWADGKDTAEVLAFYLEGSGPDTDIALRFDDGTGNLRPNPIVIERGNDSGLGTLTFNVAKTVTVRNVSSNPEVELRGADSLMISFIPPPPTRLGITASGPSIPLTMSTKIIAQLWTQHDRPAVDTENRTVLFEIREGRGTLSDLEVTIAAGDMTAQTTLTPRWPGVFVIRASTRGFDPVVTEVKVTWPALLMVLAAIGGVLGGVLAAIPKRPRKGWWKQRGVRLRCLAGLVTGFVLYWACVLGLAGVLLGDYLLNPLTAFVLSVVGGWVGTGVFALVLRGLGLSRASDDA